MTAMRCSQRVLVACDTPWTESYELDEAVFRKHIRRHLENGATDIYVLGTAGEGYAVNGAQFKRVVDVFYEETRRPGVSPQVGVISLSTSEALERIEYAHGKGFRMFQISLPSWGAVTDSEMMTFFKIVCGSYPDSRFLHYNLIRSKRLLNGGDYRRVADEVSNLVATKVSSSDMGFIRELMVKAPEMQHFFLQQAFPYGCLYGECSLLCSMGGILPGLTKQLFEAGRSGDIAESFAIQRRMFDIRDGLFGHVKNSHVDGAFDKLMTNLVEPSFSRRLLPPYETISDEDFQKAKAYYEANCGDLS